MAERLKALDWNLDNNNKNPSESKGLCLRTAAFLSQSRHVYDTRKNVRLFVVPIELVDANAAISAWHRHHQPCVGHRFSLGVVDEHGILHAAAVVGRPVARLAGDPSQVLEVTRLVSDGTKNCCSMLYAAAARAGREMGFLKIQTYILADEETGLSLKASGWQSEGIAGGGQWKHTDGKARRTDQPIGKKVRWAKSLNPSRPLLLVVPQLSTETLDLFA